MPQPLLVAIVGPTAVGKTAFAINIAQQLGSEIVSADSRQIYRLMSIGTAKPSLEELNRVPHHLIDRLNPDEPYSLMLFQRDARAAIDSISAKGKIPLLVGGTGQYLAALLEGWEAPAVAPDPELRERLYAEAEASGAKALHQRLGQADPVAAAAIDSRNVRRVVRALEVIERTGMAFSEQQRRVAPPYRILTLELTRPREELFARIDARIAEMVHAGLIREVFELVCAGYGWELPAMASLGYQEFAPLWRGEQSAAGCIAQLKTNTHRFARKQLAWFRRLPGREVLEAGAPTSLTAAISTIAAAGSAPEAQ